MTFFLILAALLLVILIIQWRACLSKCFLSLEPENKKEGLTFQLIEKTKYLQIQICSFIYIFWELKQDSILSYRKQIEKCIHSNLVDQKGNFDLLNKIYKEYKNPTIPELSKLTLWLENMNQGESINITGSAGMEIFISLKSQHIIKKYQRLVMIAGGQVLHSYNRTQLVLVLANKSEYKDILLQSGLEEYVALKTSSGFNFGKSSKIMDLLFWIYHQKYN